MKSRKRRVKAVAAVFVSVAAAVFATNLYFNKNAYVSHYTYTSDKVPTEFDGYKIAVVSDVHNSRYYEKIIARLDEQNPDLIIFSGDMIQLPETDLGNVIKIAESQRDKRDMYAVFGNHEAETKAEIRKRIASELKQCGISVLANSAADIKIGDAKIRLIGIEDSGEKTIDDTEIGKIKKTAEKNAADGTLNILICHRASLYPKIKDSAVDLIISGDLHGGVARLPFIGGLVGDEEKRFLPDYTSGVYKEDDAAEMIVSRGCDYNLVKMRIFNPPDIPIITLKSAN